MQCPGSISFMLPNSPSLSRNGSGHCEGSAKRSTLQLVEIERAVDVGVRHRRQKRLRVGMDRIAEKGRLAALHSTI